MMLFRILYFKENIYISIPLQLNSPKVKIRRFIGCCREKESISDINSSYTFMERPKLV